ncbi:hypothetical protein Poli38472_002255 [Pythium oligandrum]|uniref:RWP-RK domain-containing protein n=1 Tax=Pythium oligandrum TaxID=41045 RepID=A0A8K1FJN3_PYTOL|nr:hypothetical protein Poli38472_002255 [Pythium oligandrum]|eukprot:TMW63314.1 hypothetical protein Poli38472_002255 [Pythium oligandrum]
MDVLPAMSHEFQSSTPRERTSSTAVDFEVSELQKYYHLPLREAARRLGTCEAVIKRVCRKRQIARWPYRQVSAKLVKIQQLCKFLVHIPEGDQAQRIRQRIKQLTDEYLEIVGGQVPSDLQCTPDDAAMIPQPPPHSSSPVDATLLDQFDCAADVDMEDANASDEQDDEGGRPSDISAYSLRFILADASILDMESGCHVATH